MLPEGEAFFPSTDTLLTKLSMVNLHVTFAGGEGGGGEGGGGDGAGGGGDGGGGEGAGGGGDGNAVGALPVTMANCVDG